MSLVEQFHAEHKARLARMGAKQSPYQKPVLAIVPKEEPKKAVLPQPLYSVHRPEFYYKHMWFWDLVTFAPKPEDRTYPSIKKILSVVALHFGVSIHDMLSPRKDLKFARPRQVAMYLGKELTVKSYPQIAREIGDRDHTTAIHGYRKICKLMETDQKLRQTIEQLTSEICAP